MSIIYAVNSGIYSDYRINALFSTRDKAEQFMKSVKDDYNEVEEYELDPNTVDLIKRGYSIWSILMLRDGTVERSEEREIDSYHVMNVGTHYLWERTKASAYIGKGIPDALNSTVWAKTEKHAIKIVNEHRTKMIAQGEWK